MTRSTGAPEGGADAPPSFLRTIAAALTAIMFSVSGPLAIVLAAGQRGGLSEAAIAAMIFGGLFLNGILSVLFCAYWRQPLVFFWTIPGTILVGPALAAWGPGDVAGAFIVAGFGMLLLSVTGLVGRIMSLVPMPIVMAMVAGVFLPFGLDWIRAFERAPVIAVSMTAVFLALTAWPAAARRVPPLLAALAVGVIVIVATGAAAPVRLDNVATISRPAITWPSFSAGAVVELVVPLIITVLVVQNAQGIAVLTAAGHAPPVNAIAGACGLWSILIAPLLTPSTCLTGPTNAIIIANAEPRAQWMAGVMVGLLAMTFGLLAPLFTRLLLTAPAAFIATLAGLALLRVLHLAFAAAFTGRFAMGGIVTFLITVSGLTFLNIGAPFWGLVIGLAISWLLEPRDFADRA